MAQHNVPISINTSQQAMFEMFNRQLQIDRFIRIYLINGDFYYISIQIIII